MRIFSPRGPMDVSAICEECAFSRFANVTPLRIGVSLPIHRTFSGVFQILEASHPPCKYMNEAFRRKDVIKMVNFNGIDRHELGVSRCGLLGHCDTTSYIVQNLGPSAPSEPSHKTII